MASNEKMTVGPAHSLTNSNITAFEVFMAENASKYGHLRSTYHDIPPGVDVSGSLDNFGVPEHKPALQQNDTSTGPTSDPKRFKYPAGVKRSRAHNSTQTDPHHPAEQEPHNARKSAPQRTDTGTSPPSSHIGSNKIDSTELTVQDMVRILDTLYSEYLNKDVRKMLDLEDVKSKGRLGYQIKAAQIITFIEHLQSKVRDLDAGMTTLAARSQMMMEDSASARKMLWDLKRTVSESFNENKKSLDEEMNACQNDITSKLANVLHKLDDLYQSNERARHEITFSAACVSKEVTHHEKPPPGNKDTGRSPYTTGLLDRYYNYLKGTSVPAYSGRYIGFTSANGPLNERECVPHLSAASQPTLSLSNIKGTPKKSCISDVCGPYDRILNSIRSTRYASLLVNTPSPKPSSTTFK